MSKTWVTYRRADGEDIGGEYAWTTELEPLENDAEFSGECVEVVKETWQLTGSETIKVGPLQRWCAVCDEDVSLEEPVAGPVYCPEHKPQTAAPVDAT